MTDDNLLNTKGLGTFLKLVPVIVLLASLIGSFAVSQTRIDENRDRISKLETKQETLIRIEEQVKHLKEDAREIKEIVKGLK